MPDLTPRQIVAELDRDIVGQAEAKRAVAIALRNQDIATQAGLPDDLRAQAVMPKNILLIGPTGVGKTEIARRLAKLVGAPFVKVEATKYTEVGYYGRDVESLVQETSSKSILRARSAREPRESRLDRPGADRSPIARPPPAESAPARRRTGPRPIRTRKRRASKPVSREDEGRLDAAGEMERSGGRGHRARPFRPAPSRSWAAANMEQMEMDLQGMFEKIMPKAPQTRTMKVAEARPILLAQESEALLDPGEDPLHRRHARRGDRDHLPRPDLQDRRRR